MQLTFSWTTAALVSIPALLTWLAFVLWSRDQWRANADDYYDPSEPLPECPQPWIDDYQPWPGGGAWRDEPYDRAAEIETVTALWHGAMNDGDTVMADVLFAEYERLIVGGY